MQAERMQNLSNRKRYKTKFNLSNKHLLIAVFHTLPTVAVLQVAGCTIWVQNGQILWVFFSLKRNMLL